MNRPKPNIKTWKIKALGSIGNLEKNVIYISASKFTEVVKSLSIHGYNRGKPCSEGVRYPHHSIQDLNIVLNKENKIIIAEYTSQSGLSALVSDFGLPAYNSD
jgi:hypothetical protein